MTGVCRGGRGESGHGLFDHRSKQTLIIVFVCLFAHSTRWREIRQQTRGRGG